MDQIRLHLIVTHLPVCASLLGAIVLAYGIWAGSSSTKKSAYIVFLVSATATVLAYMSGEGAKDIIKTLGEATGNAIRNHRNFAQFSFGASSVLAIMSVTCLLTRFRNRTVSRALAGITVFLALITFALSAWTGYLGLQIRHTEMNKSGVRLPGPDAGP